jgi:chromosome segregation ATPase
MENVIDTRDLQERIEELEEFQTVVDAIKEEIAEHTEEIAEVEKEFEDLSVEESDENLADHEREVVEEKIEEVKTKLEVMAENLCDLETDLEIAEDDFSEEEKAELEVLLSLRDEVSEWHSGNQLINENYFTEYAQELCEEIGDVPKNLPHYISINWEETADNIKADYSECTYNGDTYLYRNC